MLSQSINQSVVTAPSVHSFKIDWIGHHKNLDIGLRNTPGRQDYQEPGVEAESNFEFFEFTIISFK